MSTQLLDSGLHLNVSEARYHADPCVATSLSSSLVRTILDRSVGHAKLKHPRLSTVTPNESTPAMVLGTCLHALMSNDLSHLALDADFSDYKTKLAQHWKEAVVAQGKTPVLPHVFKRAEKVADALRFAGTPNNGAPEVTAIWQEKPFGDKAPAIYCRARFDRLIEDAPHYLDIHDWKTTETPLTADSIARHIASQGYDIQIAHYLRALEVLRPEYAGRATFTLWFVEVNEPYAVQSVCLTESWLSRARTAWRRGLRQWATAMHADHWPLADSETLKLEAPGWHAMRLEGGAQ
jgi:hypothetical protein